MIGTSGDTGSAAITAVQGLKWVDIVVLLPKGRCTEIQVRFRWKNIWGFEYRFIFSWKTANHLDLAVLPGRRVTTT